VIENIVVSLITAIVTAAVSTLGFFKWLGQRWLEGKFAERFEAYKNEQRKELEDYKFKINSLFNRITKIHEKEIEVLPTVWQKLIDAFSYVNAFISPFQEVQDLNRMDPDELQYFIKTSELEEIHKKKLLEAPDKNKYYHDISFWYGLNKVHKYVRDFHAYLLYNKIFLSSDIYERFKAIDDLLFKALVEQKLSKMFHLNDPTKGDFKACEEIRDKAQPKIDEISDLVQKRLHHPEA
jgi:hypothetical protein